jgi:hypothetical protein
VDEVAGVEDDALDVAPRTEVDVPDHAAKGLLARPVGVAVLAHDELLGIGR